MTTLPSAPKNLLELGKVSVVSAKPTMAAGRIWRIAIGSTSHPLTGLV
jgi:hypothetical protein